MGTIYNKTFISLIFLFVFGLSAKAIEETKTVKCGYQIDSSASVELNNQYGEIEIVDWDKDSVKVEATIEVRSDDVFAARELFELVEVTCRGNRTNVVVNTEWTEASNIWKRGAIDFKKRYGSDKNLVINYKVYMPTSCRLTINNRFGDVYLPNYEGALRIEIAHGDLRAREVKDARKIEVKYGKILIKNLEQGLIYLSYGNLIVDKADRVTLESKSSNVEFFEIEKLSIDSRNDDIRLEQVNTVRGQLTYSQMRVKEIVRQLDLNTNYGDVIIKSIKNDFYSIRLNGSSTDYDLEFEENSTFQFSVESSGNKSVSFMKEAEFTEEEKDGNTNFIKGFLRNKEAKSLVDIVSKNGYISFY